MTRLATAKTNVLEDQEESVRIAVKALGAMRNAPGLSRSESFQTTPALTSASSSPPPSPSLSSRQDFGEENGFVSRMSSFPFVGGALRAYEKGKASSTLVKYGAEMVESGVITVSKPVISRLPVNVNQLDEFACRQLDRFDRYRRPSINEGNTLDSLARAAEERESSEVSHSAISSRKWDHGSVPSWIKATSSYTSQDPPSTFEDDIQVQEDRTATPQPDGHWDKADRREQQIVKRSRWHTVLSEAGGISAALSNESMQRLQVCLQRLQVATAHIDAQILILRDFIATLQPLPPSSQDTSHPSSPSSPISPTHMRTLTDAKADIVKTVKTVVEIVSKYTGSALPGPARERVRGFILKLPQRWASAANVKTPNHGLSESNERENVIVAASTGGSKRNSTGRRAAWRERGAGSEGSRSAAVSPMSSRAASPSPSPRRPHHHHGEMTAGTAVIAAQRVLTLATESLDMMRGVTGVVKDSLDRADAWVERLRAVGIRQSQIQPTEDVEKKDDRPLTERRELPPLVPTNQPHAYADAPSPASHIGTGISALSLNTPRLGTAQLEDEEEGEEEEGEEEEEAKKMDVDDGCI